MPTSRSPDSSGDRYPSELCGLSLLYSSRQASIFALASASVSNQFAFRHSSRNLPLKLSTCPFCIGRPGSMNTGRICRFSHHTRKWRDVNSGPLSHRIAAGFPRSAITRSSTLVTRCEPRQLSASMAGHSRVKRSTIVSARKLRPVASESITKSIAHSRFGAVSITFGGAMRCTRLRFSRSTARCS